MAEEKRVKEMVTAPQTDTLADAQEVLAQNLEAVLGVVGAEQYETEALAFVLDLSDTDLAHLIEAIPPDLRKSIWPVIPESRQWLVLNALQSSTAGHLIASLSEYQRAMLVSMVDDADILALAADLPEHFLDALLEEVSTERATEVQEALAYDEHQIGRYIDTNILRVRPRLPLARLLLRMQARFESPPQAVFVVNRDGVLQGRLDFSDLLAANPESYVGTMARPVRPYLDSDRLEDVARSVDVEESGDWLPVIREDKVVGALSPGILVRELKRQNLDQLVTDAGPDEEDLFTPVREAARIRAFWLLVNLATAFLASAVIGLFEDVVQKVVTLAVLMPVVASMGGIAGSQTLAIALRGLALKHLSDANLPLVVAKEMRIAALNGLVLGAFIGLIVWQWFDSASLGMIIFCAIVLNGLAAAAAGTYVPFWLQRLRIDPAVSGSVILTTVTDVVGFFVFLGLGTLVFIAL